MSVYEIFNNSEALNTSLCIKQNPEIVNTRYSNISQDKKGVLKSNTGK